MMNKSGLARMTPFRRYIAVGLVVYAVELLCIYVYRQFSQNTTAAVAVSFWVGFVLSFLLQKFVAFQDNRTQKGLIGTQFTAYFLLVVFNFGFTILITRALDSVAPIYLTRTFALGITTIWNFYLYKTRIFAKAGTLPPIE